MSRDDDAAEQPPEWQRYLHLKQRSREHLGAGLGLGALSVGAAAAVGAVCPMCVVAVPALISSGLWSRHKSRKAREEAGLDPAQPHDRAPEPA